MAINEKDYPNIISVIGTTTVTGLREHYELSKYLFRFKINGKSYRRIIDYSDKSWDKRTINNKLIQDMKKYRDNPDFDKIDLSKKVEPKYKATYTLNKIVDRYFKDNEDGKKNSGKTKYKSSWIETKKNHYDKYIRSKIGHIKLSDIKVSTIRESLQYQQSQGLKARTVRTTLELLRPLFAEAVDDNAITTNPCNAETIVSFQGIKREKTKKDSKTPLETLQVFYRAIIELFEDNPYYLSFYLLTAMQRRKSEVMKLRWENVNFNENTYTCKDTKNGEEQTFYLPQSIKEQLLKFREIEGWVYSSPINKEKHITNIEKQTSKVKEKVIEIYTQLLISRGMTNKRELQIEIDKKPKFTLHYFRNLGSSLLQQKGMEAYISGALGHSNMNTKDLYTTVDYTLSSKQFSETLESELKL